MKAALKAALLAELEAALATARAAHESAVEGVTHEDARAETAKDTRGLEQSYLARGIAQRVAELEAAVATTSKLALRTFTDRDAIAVGALVAIDDAGTTRRLFLATHGGGITLPGDVTVLTPTSPIGRALLGKHVDDEFEVAVGGAQRTLTVSAIE